MTDIPQNQEITRARCGFDGSRERFRGFLDSWVEEQAWSFAADNAQALARTRGSQRSVKAFGDVWQEAQFIEFIALGTDDKDTPSTHGGRFPMTRSPP
jgi:hypothetical protein